jgi:gliding motility-associated lipoprotein GldH
VYEQNIDIPEYIWDKDNPVYFDVEIKDTVSLHNVYINIRNASGYAYSNLYLFLDTKYPNNSMSRDTIECILADPSGKWLGDGSGDIWDNQILFKKNVRFKQIGTYKFRYEQAMRMPKLPMIMDVGLRIEKQ